MLCYCLEFDFYHTDRQATLYNVLWSTQNIHSSVFRRRKNINFIYDFNFWNILHCIEISCIFHIQGSLEKFSVAFGMEQRLQLRFS